MYADALDVPPARVEGRRERGADVALGQPFGDDPALVVEHDSAGAPTRAIRAARTSARGPSVESTTAHDPVASSTANCISRGLRPHTCCLSGFFCWTAAARSTSTNGSFSSLPFTTSQSRLVTISQSLSAKAIPAGRELPRLRGQRRPQHARLVASRGDRSRWHRTPSPSLVNPSATRAAPD